MNMLRADHSNRTILSILTTRKQGAFGRCSGMDRNSVFNKTAKGHLESMGRTRALPRDMRALLKEMDGHATAGEAQAKIDKFSDAKLLEVLEELVNGDFIRESETTAKKAAPSLPAPPPTAAISGLASKPAGELAARAGGENSQDELERTPVPRWANTGILTQEASPRAARASPLFWRQTTELSALIVAYLQYFYFDVQLQILSLPTITT